MNLETAKQGLNAKQIEMLVSLVRLGDSVELALKTTIEEFANRPWIYDADYVAKGGK